jgi:hypothetical protein
MKAETQIKHKEEMGDDLKFIDFHQLQIENKKHVKDIDERNKKLLALKLNAGKTVQTLNGLKKKLQDAIREQDMISSEMKIKQGNQKKTIESIKKTKEEIAVANFNNKYQNAMKAQMKDMPNPSKFVEQKIQAEKLHKFSKNVERKIEIATVAAKEARAVIRANTGYINNVDMGDLEYN